MNALLLATACGMALAFGLWAVVGGMTVATEPRLADAIDLLDGALPQPVPSVGRDRLGSWLRARVRRPMTAEMARRLRMIGRPVDHHFTLKAVAAFAGVSTALLATTIGAWLGGAVFAAAAVILVPLGAACYFLPDAILISRDRDLTQDTTEALLSYFDLVTLERLANLSGPQALRAAASVSDATIFVLIRDALERAQLEQRSPYGDLKRLADELQLPALGDIADVMSLDESGASLAGALQARVKELRDAHLTEAKIEASAISERMTFFMVVPALVFAAFFLVPPMLRLLAG